MPEFDGKAFGREMAVSVKELVAPLISRLDALEKRELDILAPHEVATEMTAAISMLSTAAPVTKAIERGPGAMPPLRPRTFRFDRDERGLITGAFEDYGP